MKREKVYKTSFVLLIVLGLFFSILSLYIYYSEKSDNYNGFVLGWEASNFKLLDHNGNEVSLTDFKDKIVLLNFGYTNCPDICPTTLSVLNNVVNNLGQKKNEVQVIFISVDPERDNIERLKSYIPHFNESFIGLTGTPESIDDVAKAYNVYYTKEFVDSKSGYLMGHTSSVFLVDKSGTLLLKFSQAKLIDDLILQDIKKIIN